MEIPYIAAKPGNCGLGCVAMLIAHDQDSHLEVGQLAQKYKTEKYYIDQIGWKHDGLVTILKDHGLDAFRAENQTISQITQALEKDRPVIVSIKIPEINNLSDKKIYTAKDKTLPLTGHLCVVVGVQGKTIKLHDPRNVGKYKESLSVPLDDFNRVFTGRCIYVI